MKRLVFDSWLVDPYRVLLMDGIEGKRSFLASLMGWQSNRTWWTVSYGCIQRLHSGRCRGLNLLMWLFSLLWPVLNWKMLHWSGLGRLFIGSSFTGFDMWLYITRPVVPDDHTFLIYEGNIGLLVFKLIVSVSSITCNHLCYKYVSK